MSENLWDRINKVHARCIKSYAGVPNFVSYATVTKLLGIKTAKEELLAFGRKRLLFITAFYPFGPEIIRNCRMNVQDQHSDIINGCGNHLHVLVLGFY